MDSIDVAIVGAGPHGLSAAARLRRTGVDAQVFGDPMGFWRGMPTGMLLRSNWTATSIGEKEGPLSLDAYVAETGRPVDRPVPLENFIEYGLWLQRKAAPAVDRRLVEKVQPAPDGFAIRLDDGEELRARRVVVAAGIAPFKYLPPIAAGLPSDLVSHTADHCDMTRFKGLSVCVIGGGQSALESAALLHEAGASVEVFVRSPRIIWLHGGKYQRRLGRFAPVLYAPTDVGPMGLSRLVAAPRALSKLPRSVQDRAAYRSIRPAGAAWLVSRLTDVPIHVGQSVSALQAADSQVEVTFTDGRKRTADHVLFGTGYRVDVAKYGFLSAELRDGLDRRAGYPILRAGFESSVSRLHFLGAPAAWSFGPTMRFVSGSWVASSGLTRAVAAARQ